jgi:plasmid stability protein
MSCNIHLRNVDDNTMHRLREEAARYDISMNTLILNLVKNGLGFTSKRTLNVYHDLDALAGTWSEKKAQTFLKDISDFEQIDKEIWK